MAEPAEPAAPPLRDIGTLVAARTAQYLDLVERAGRRLMEDDYHSEDFVEDWFTGLGMVVRDTISATTVGWRTVLDASWFNDAERSDAQR
jgi:hypothetical protein